MEMHTLRLIIDLLYDNAYNFDILMQYYSYLMYCKAHHILMQYYCYLMYLCLRGH